MNTVGSRRQYLDLRAFLTAVVDKGLGVLKIPMLSDRLAVQPPGVKRRTVGRRNDADLAGRNHCCRCDRNAEKVRMDSPLTRRQRPELNTLDASLLDERDRVLEIVVCILRP